MNNEIKKDRESGDFIVIHDNDLDLDICKFCLKSIPNECWHHMHQESWVCDDCWDERLRITE